MKEKGKEDQKKGKDGIKEKTEKGQAGDKENDTGVGMYVGGHKSKKCPLPLVDEIRSSTMYR